MTPRNHITAVNFSTAARSIAENSDRLPADGRRRSKSGTGHWSEGSLVRKLYSRRVRVSVRFRTSAPSDQ